MKRTALTLIFCFLVCWTATAQTDQNAPLSLEQILELVAIPAPDGVIASEIKRRGLRFRPSEDTVSRLTRSGAGQETLAAIRARLPITEEPVEVPKKGTLEIVPSLTGVTIEIEGVGQFDAVQALPLRAGTYRIKVTCPLCEESAQTVVLAAGQAVRKEIEVPIDRVKIQILLSGGVAYFERGEYRGALENAEVVLGVLPGDGEALRLASESAYMLGLGDKLARYGSATLLTGNSIRLPVRHKRRLGGKLLDGWMTLSAAGFEFESEETSVLRGGGQEVAAPWNALREVSMDTGESNEPWLVLITRKPKSGKDDTIRVTHPGGPGTAEPAGRSALEGARRLLLGGIGQQSG